MLTNLKSIFILGHICVLSLASGREGWPDYVHHVELSGYLKLHPEPADWLTARYNCHSEGAVLASPWTAKFTSTVTGLQENEDQSLPVLFSGAKETFPEGLPGILMDLELCGVFYSNGTTGDVACSERLPYVCYAPEHTLSPTPAPSRPAPVPSCGEHSVGYEFAALTAHCYKFHTQALNWTDANSTCAAEGAHLAIINSPAEAKFLSDLFGKYPDAVINGTKYTDYAAVGVHLVSSEWKTIEGQSLKNTGYDTWGGMVEHRHDADTKPYGFMNRSGKYNNGSNSTEHAFICEKAPAPSQNQPY